MKESAVLTHLKAAYVLPTPQLKTIICLGESGGETTEQIARALQLHPRYVAATLLRMSESKLVTRRVRTIADTDVEYYWQLADNFEVILMNLAKQCDPSAPKPELQ